MNIRFNRYLAPSCILIFALLVLINFITIRSIDNKIEHFMNYETETYLGNIKVRCKESVSGGNLIFTKYNKTYKDCKLYNSIGADFHEKYDYNRYLAINELNISYKITKGLYRIIFNELTRKNDKNILNNYTLSFSDDVIFEIRHNSEKITDVYMENNGPVSLTHSSGIKIADISAYNNVLNFTDNESELGAKIKLKFKYQTLKNFIKFMQQNSKKHVLNPDILNNFDSDIELKFERFSKDEQKKMKKSNPEAYKDEKNFFKNLIYNINHIIFSNSEFTFKLHGNVVKVPESSVPYTDLHFEIENFYKLFEYIKKSTAASFYNEDKITFFQELKIDVMIDALIKTLEDFDLLEENNLYLHIKSDSIGTVSISGINFFAFQKKLLVNFIDLAGIADTVQGMIDNLKSDTSE